VSEAIVYCDRCGRIVLPSEIERGDCVRLGEVILCATCSEALPAEERERASAAPTRRPDRRWKFDEGSGTGVADSSGNGVAGRLVNLEDSWFIGKDLSGKGYGPLHGVVDDVRVFNTALTDGEVAGLYREMSRQARTD